MTAKFVSRNFSRSAVQVDDGGAVDPSPVPVASVVSVDSAVSPPRAGGLRSALPRAGVVWAAFFAACVGAVGILSFTAPTRRASLILSEVRQSPAMAQAVASSIAAPRIAPRDTPMARGYWRAIVIHDSGSPAGDLASLERQHLDAGLTGLGFHFVIGNGQGMEDGKVSAGYRWERQLAGAHASARMRAPRPLRSNGAVLDAAGLNQYAVAVCMVGNGARRPFTDLQVRELLTLVRALQAELGIGRESVLLASELLPGSAVGSYFPAESFRSQLLP